MHRILRVNEPATWPEAPQWMSFSTLLELEACPRRWALKSGLYPDLWEQRGYPNNPNLFALEGIILHSAIEEIVSAFSENGCKSVQDENTFATLQTLGGYTTVLRNSMQKTLRQFENNPRVLPILETISHALEMRMPELRSRLQRQISRIELSAGLKQIVDHLPGDQVNARYEIPYGSNSEVEVRAPELGWRGFIDLLTVTKESCEIRDFKTGIAKEVDELQLRVYALLWARDRSINPSSRLATRLVLSYADRNAEVQPLAVQSLDELEEELRNRTAKAFGRLKDNPPEAVPNIENCSYCSVRHLCNDYWKWHNREVLNLEIPESQIVDCEIILTTRHGTSSWDGLVMKEAGSSPIPVLLRIQNDRFDLEAGQRIRALNVQLNTKSEEDDNLPIVALVMSTTEIFLVPESE